MKRSIALVVFALVSVRLYGKGRGVQAFARGHAAAARGLRERRAPFVHRSLADGRANPSTRPVAK
jgi:hypothetical protein